MLKRVKKKIGKVSNYEMGVSKSRCFVSINNKDIKVMKSYDVLMYYILEEINKKKIIFLYLF